MNFPSKLVYIAAGFAALVTLSACEKPQAAQQERPLTKVSVAEVIQHPVNDWDELTGRLEAPQSVVIRARVSGYIDQIAFQEGELVKKGDLLVQIDPRPFAAEVKRLAAQLDRARATAKRADSEAKRGETLRAGKIIGGEEADARNSTAAEAKAAVAATQAQLDIANLNLSFTEVRAPIAGRISRQLVTEGNLVRENETLLTTVVQVDPVYFYFDIDERSYLSYQRIAKQGGQSSSGGSNGRGLQVSVMLTDEKTFTHQGVLDFTDNRVDAATGTMRLRAVFENKDQFLTPGLFGRIAVPGSPQYQAVMIPDDYVPDLNVRLSLYRRLSEAEKAAEQAAAADCQVEQGGNAAHGQRAGKNFKLVQLASEITTADKRADRRAGNHADLDALFVKGT